MNNAQSSFKLCLESCGIYGLTPNQARAIVENQIDTIENSWDEVADLARLSAAEQRVLRHRSILNPFAGYGFPASRDRADVAVPESPIDSAWGRQSSPPAVDPADPPSADTVNKSSQ